MPHSLLSANRTQAHVAKATVQLEASAICTIEHHSLALGRAYRAPRCDLYQVAWAGAAAGALDALNHYEACEGL